MSKTLFYIHDPMCSWCWGFRNTWEQVYKELEGKVDIRYLVGGLAPDSQEPMPESMKEKLQHTWKKIQAHIPGTEFNFDFWRDCKPRRSTYPACRAVLAAKAQDKQKERAMILAIQQAYYLGAKNPSDDDTLVQLAVDLELDRERFLEDLNSEATHQLMQQEILFAQQIGARGFPSMVLKEGDRYRLLGLDYNDAGIILQQVL